MDPSSSPLRSARLKQSFDLFDPDGQGVINPSELKSAIISVGIDHCKGTVHQRLQELEKKNEMIDFDLFCDIMAGHVIKDTQKDIRRLFRMYDFGGKGFIDARDLETVSEIAGGILTKQEIQELLSQGEGGLVLQEHFYSIMTRSTSIFS